MNTFPYKWQATNLQFIILDIQKIKDTWIFFPKFVLLRITFKNNLICRRLYFRRKKEKTKKMDNKFFNRQDYCDCRMAEAEGGVVGSCFFHVSAPRNHLFATPRRPEHNYNLKLVSFLIWTTWTSNSTPFTCVQQDNGNSR